MTELRRFINELDENPEIENDLLSDADWMEIENLVSILKPFEGKTTKVQNPNISLSDVFGFWLSVKIQTQKAILQRNDEFAKLLFKEMEKRETELFQNPIFISAIFLDPRYQCVLSENVRNDAIRFLVGLYNRLYPNTNIEQETGQDTNTLFRSKSEEDLYSFLDTIGSDQYQPSSSTNAIGSATISENTSIREELEKFNGKKEQLKDITIFEYWASIKDQFPDLYCVASVVHCVPSSQCTVERAFSALRLILSHLRTQISDELLEQILLIRLNTPK